MGPPPKKGAAASPAVCLESSLLVPPGPALQQVWIFHCHLLYHQYMGQMVLLAEAVDELPERPSGLPKCPSTCFSNAAPWKHSYVRKEWGGTGYEIP